MKKLERIEDPWGDVWCKSEDVDKLEALNIELLKALKLMTIICDNVHHSKKDRHEYGEPCPPVERIRAAIAKAEVEEVMNAQEANYQQNKETDK